MEMRYETKMILPADCTVIDQEDASRIDGGGFLLTALGIYGAYSVYNNFKEYVNNNSQVVQQFQKSLAAGFSSFLSVFEKFAVLKVSFDILKMIF